MGSRCHTPVEDLVFVATGRRGSPGLPVITSAMLQDAMDEPISIAI